VDVHHIKNALTANLALIVMLFAACGENGDGNDDTLWTGISGVVILVIVIWLILRAMKKRKQ
jgi:hypothetical protein